MAGVTLLVRMTDDLERNRLNKDCVAVRKGIQITRGAMEVYPLYMVLEISDAEFSECRKWTVPIYDTTAPPIGFDEDLQENIYPILYRRRVQFKFSNMGQSGQDAARDAYELNLPFTVTKAQAHAFMRTRDTDLPPEGLD